MATVTSEQGKLNFRDFIKGLIVAVLTPAFTIAIDSLNEGSLTFNWAKIGATAGAAMLAYLLKNLFQPTQITMIPATKEEAEAVKSGEAEVIVQTK